MLTVCVSMKKDLKGKWGFNRELMSANMKAGHLALWMLPSHVGKEQNTFIPHSSSPSLKNHAAVRGKGGYQVPLSSCYRGWGVCGPFHYYVPVGCISSKEV